MSFDQDPADDRSELELCIEEIKKLKKWFPATEFPPKSKDPDDDFGFFFYSIRVLAVDKWNKKFVAYYQYWQDEDDTEEENKENSGWHTNCSETWSLNDDNGDILHWTYLPDSPKKKEEKSEKN